MSEPIRTINRYALAEILKSDREIDYNCFYKRQVEEMVEILREEYKKLLEEKMNHDRQEE